jgi:hypothetical protein
MMINSSRAIIRYAQPQGDEDLRRRGAPTGLAPVVETRDAINQLIA